MKNSIYLILVLILFFTSCKVDETMEEIYRQPFSHYKIGDTIFYKNSSSGLDTIRIASIDSFSYTGRPLYPSYKIINLKIEHLPINKWFSGLTSNETNTKKLDTILTDFIHLIKDQSWNKKNDKYYMYVGYRDFSGKLDIDEIHKNKIDTILTERGKASYSRYKLNEDSVIEVYWSLNEGMVGYKKNNGEVYNLVVE